MPGIPTDPVTAALTAGQAVLGTIQAVSGSQRAKRLLQMRRAYQTPEEYYKIIQGLQSNAGTGYDPFTLNYLTNQTDQAFSSTLGTAERLGANPNDLSGLFANKVNSIMKVGAENHALNMENIGKYFTGLDVLGQNKAAEQKSQQDLIKDQQAAAADKQAGLQNIFGAANTFLSGYAADKANALFAPKPPVPPPPGPTYTPQSTTGDIRVPTAANPSNSTLSSPALDTLLNSFSPEQLNQFYTIFNKPQ
jgi:hypothetical protein